jgi:plasmid stabilization system protein ParE
MVGRCSLRSRSIYGISWAGAPVTAAIVAGEIIDKAQILSEHPRLGRPIAGREEYRQIVLQVLGAAYVFQYRFDGRRLMMLRVFHAREARE